MRLVACSQCHAQYDVTEVTAATIPCPCGTPVANVPHDAVDAGVHRCGSCGAAVTAETEACAYCGSIIARVLEDLSLVCPECYARNAEESRFCTNCGVEFQPQAAPLDADGDALRCPHCDDVALSWRSIGGVGARECPACHGLWVPGVSFDRLVSRALETRRKLTQAGAAPSSHRERITHFQSSVVYRKCPVCSGTMQRKNYGRKSGVIVDWCGHHGTWLDADELEDIAAFILDGGLAQKQAPGEPGMGAWGQPADAKRMEALIAAERLMGAERIKLEKKKRLLLEPDDGVFDTIGDLLSGWLD